MEKKLYRSTTDSMICGVCGGIAEYLGLDATLVRLGTFILIFLGVGSIIPIYFVAACIIPKRH